LKLGQPNNLFWDNVTSLLNKSLIFQEEDAEGEPRIMLLESIRQFIQQQLSEEEKLQYSQVYCDHFLSIVSEAKENLMGSDQQRWLSLIEKENNNLRAVYEWLIKKENNLQAGISLVMGLYRFWLIRSPSEGIEKTDQLIKKLGPSTEPLVELAQLYTNAATLAQSPGLYLKASEYYERSLSIYRQLNDRHGIAVTLNHLGWMGWRLGNFDITEQRSLEGLELHKALQNPVGVATSLNNLGAAAHNQGNFQLAKEYHSEALTIRKHFSDRRAIAFSKLGLGQALSYYGEFSEAEETLKEALEVFESLTDNSLRAYTINALADLKYLENKLDEARLLIEDKSLPIVRWLGSRFGQGLSLRVLGDVHLAKKDYPSAEKYHQESYEHREKSNDTWCMAQSLHRLAVVAAHVGDYSLAKKRIQRSLDLRLRMKDKFGLLECLEFYLFIAWLLKRFDLAAELNHYTHHFRAKYRFKVAPIEKVRFEKLNFNDITSRTYLQETTITESEEIWDFTKKVISKSNHLLFPS
jgi:tetratricopeptide (TPR) repeat protein